VPDLRPVLDDDPTALPRYCPACDVMGHTRRCWFCGADIDHPDLKRRAVDPSGDCATTRHEQNG
jgi:hypothetical protein